MVRPRKRKRINFQPEIRYFKPQGVPLKELEEITLTMEETEALRLVNIMKLQQTTAAERMEIHQSTFQRTLTRAREKITDAIINGKAIKIEGGEYKMPNGDRTGPEGKGSRTGRKAGKCSGSETAGNESDRPRRGLGRGPRNGQGRNQ